MQVHHDEGIANRIDPESCADAREGIGEALTGECIGQPLSRESTLILGADVDFEEAAGVPLAALTALQALRDELGVKPGQKAFISGGAGGVGTFAIQIAKWLGAHVTTTASKWGEALVRSLGADEVIDYTSDDLSRFGKDFDAGFDLIGGETLDRMFKIMKPGTRIVSVRRRSGAADRAAGISSPICADSIASSAL